MAVCSRILSRSGLLNVYRTGSSEVSSAFCGSYSAGVCRSFTCGNLASRATSNMCPADGTGRSTMLGASGVVTVPHRTYVHADRSDGKKRTDEEVPMRYFRLDWGGWIRRVMGAHKRVHKMHPRRLRVKDAHVFVPRNYARKFDRMVTTEYRTIKYYVDDIYEPYQTRHNQGSIYYISPADELHRKLEFPELSSEILARRKGSSDKEESQSEEESRS